MNKSVFVKDISAGDKVRDVFLVTGKNLAVSQKGNPYLSLRLRDRTGEVEGRVWENALAVNERFERGDIIEVQARVVSFRNELQLSIYECLPVDDAHMNPADFSPASRYDIEEMFEALTSIMNTVENPSLRNLLETTFADNRIAGAFKRAPAAKGFHHAYIGGLLEHTLSVVRLLDLISSHYEGVNRDLLIAGGALHDIGKIDELSFATIIDYTDEGRLVGHIVRGVEIVDRIIQQLSDFPERLALELRHILLSHHGLLEFGSPKRPKTLEALMVNFADDLDAKMNAFQYHMSGSSDDSSWTTYHRLLERYIYKGPSSSGKVSDDGNSNQD